MSYAADTSVPVARSRAEIERLVGLAGGADLVMGEDSRRFRALVGFQLGDRRLLFSLPLPEQKDYRTEQRYQQALRARWRALVLTLKAKLVSVQAGVETLDEAFLAQVVVPGPGGPQRFSEVALPAIGRAYQGHGLPPLLGAGS